MKKIFLFFLSFSLFVYAETRRGFPVSVELISGAKQNAELVGAAGDTLFLGGFVADTFTVVKILKSRVAYAAKILSTKAEIFPMSGKSLLFYL